MNSLKQYHLICLCLLGLFFPPAVSYASYREIEEFISSSTDNTVLDIRQYYSAPSFPGGFNQLQKWVDDNFKYPTNALKYKIEDNVIAQFTITEDGSMEDIWLWAKRYPELDKEIVNLLHAMPKWQPAIENNKAVPAIVVCGFYFHIDSIFESLKGNLEIYVPVIEGTVEDFFFDYSQKRDFIDYPFSFEEESINYIFTPAEFSGGLKNLYSWLRDNIYYPAEAQIEEAEGTVKIKLVILENGEVDNPQIIQSVDPILDRTAIEIIRKMPNWIPATLMKRNVKDYMVLPINFKFEED